MVRWQPGAKDRLQAAALDLYLTRGFEQTTVTEIAASVGLTERTFFRHFADKREVLFDGQELLAQAFLNGVDAAADDATPMETVAAALDTAAEFFPEERREHSRRRQEIIEANPGLQERELLKLAGLAAAIAAALGVRGVPEPVATLAAQSGVTVFAVAFAQWIETGEVRSFTELERDSLDALRDVTRSADDQLRLALRRE